MLSVSRVDDFDLPGEADLKVYQRLWIRKIVGDRGGYRPRVLEIGPGTSVDLVDHLQFGEYWVLDAAPQWRRAGVRVIEGALGEVALPRDYFDVVCSVSVLEHLQHEDWPAAAEALRSCLRRGGLSAHCIDGKCRGRSGDHFEQMLLWKEFLLNTGLTWLDPPASLSSPSVFGDRGVWSMSEAAWRRWWASPGDEWDQAGRPVSINLAMTRPRFSPRRVLYGINRRLQGA